MCGEEVNRQNNIPGDQFEVRSVLTANLDGLLALLNAFLIVFLFEVDGWKTRKGLDLFFDLSVDWSVDQPNTLSGLTPTCFVVVERDFVGIQTDCLIVTLQGLLEFLGFVERVTPLFGLKGLHVGGEGKR